MKWVLGYCFLSSLILFLISCVSRTVPEDRFKDSAALSIPTFNISLADNNNFTFAVVGDLHVGGADTTRLNAILSAAQTEGDSFVVFLGDIADSGAAVDYTAILTSLTTYGFSQKALWAIGNHDIFNDGWTNYKAAFGPSYYSVNVGNSRFIAIDSADGGMGPLQTQWFRDEMNKSMPTNTFIISHYLPLVPNLMTYLRWSDEIEGKKLMHLASNKGVRSWFGGHFHSYAVGNFDNVDYVCAGGGGGRRMGPVLDYFFVQVTVAGSRVTYSMKTVP